MKTRNELAKDFFSAVSHLNDDDAICALSLKIDISAAKAGNLFQRMGKYRHLINEISALSIVMGWILARKSLKDSIHNGTNNPF